MKKKFELTSNTIKLYSILLIFLFIPLFSSSIFDFTWEYINGIQTIEIKFNKIFLIKNTETKAKFINNFKLLTKNEIKEIVTDTDRQINDMYKYYFTYGSLVSEDSLKHNRILKFKYPNDVIDDNQKIMFLINYF